ncbi:MAG: glycosyltransferase family 2 protein [Deltaproteobacteria bacterium]|nr:glycosyltransferase family 2 protein [Deltaproteobacteria bacterium]
MNKRIPPVLSIGFPVYNGGRFTALALESILAQKFGDFEIIISDNASTDETREVCESFAAKDRRIIYRRNHTNLGAAKNFNTVYYLSSGKYFKWMANDDIYDPDWVLECLNVLKKDSSVVLCHTKTKRIDENGDTIGHYGLVLRSDSKDPVTRFSELVLIKHACFQIFGIMRKEVLKKTNIFGAYAGADRVLLAEMGLWGRHYEVPSFLFLRRSHSHESRRLYPERNTRVAWFDPSRASRIAFSEWRMLKEYYLAVNRSPLSQYERVKCYAVLGKMFKRDWRGFAHDIKSAGLQIMNHSSAHAAEALGGK